MPISAGMYFSSASSIAIKPPLVNFLHSSQDAVPNNRVNELRQRGLRKLVRMHVRRLLQKAQAFNHAFRAYAPADAKARKRNFRKTVDLNHIAVAVQRFEAGNVGASQTKARVNAVLNHRHLIARRKFEQTLSLGERHGRTRRIVEIRRDEESV